MRILFVMRHSGFVRNFETVLRLLAERGHSVHLAFELERDQAEVAERLSREHPAITYGPAPVRGDRWRGPAWSLREGINYLRYLAPIYRDATKLRARARSGAPGWLVAVTTPRLGRSRLALEALDRWLRWLERSIPPSDNLERFVAESGADVLFVTPLVAGFSQSDYVHAARRLRLPVVLPVTSWDNLTNKGLVRDDPDRVYVWNEAQRREAIELHGLEPERVEAVGAHTYDHWFAWRPTQDRETFCARVGLDPSRPFVLYVCSSGFICPDERPVVASWLAELRKAGGVLADVGVLVRPHPSLGHLWNDNPVAGEADVAVWPPTGADPRTLDAKADYYDSMHHAALVVGINTSALIESAIVGRRTYTVLRPELRATQEGTLHFHHLVRENGGPLVTAHSFEEHLAQLEEGLTVEEPEWNRAFLEHFVRPYGLDTPAAPRLVRDVEELYAGFAPRPLPPSSPVARALLSVACVVSGATPSADPGRPWGRRRKPLRRRVRRSARRFVRRGYDFTRLRVRRGRRAARGVSTAALRRVLPARVKRLLRTRLGRTGTAPAARVAGEREARERTHA